jgi:hypothetical protein
MKRARTAAEIAKLARRSRRSYCISANGTTQPGRSLRLRYVARLAKRVAVLDEKLSRCCKTVVFLGRQQREHLQRLSKAFMEIIQCGFVPLSRGLLGGLSSGLLHRPSRERDTTSFVILGMGMLGMGMTRFLTSNG